MGMNTTQAPNVGETVTIYLTYGQSTQRHEVGGIVTSVSPDGRYFGFEGRTEAGITRKYDRVPVRRIVR
jgi:hypothetical protein